MAAHIKAEQFLFVGKLFVFAPRLNRPRPGTQRWRRNFIEQRYLTSGAISMGNGSSGTSGPGSTVLKALPLPAQTLTISSLFPDQAVVFPFGALPVDMRRQFAGCFGR